MQKRIAEIIGTLVLVGILALVVVQNVFKKKPASEKKPAVLATTTSAPAVQGSGSASPAAAALPATNEEKMKLQKARADTTWGRDPFQRAKTAEFGYRTSSLELKGISIGANGEGFALINQEIVKEGDKIEGCEVMAVEKNRVLLQKGGQSFYLKLPEEVIESPKPNK